MEFTTEQKQELRKLRLKWIGGGLLVGILLTVAGVVLAANSPGGFSLWGLEIHHERGVKDTPIVMEGGSIHAHSDLSWTVDPQLSTRYTTDLPDNVKTIVVRDSYDETKEVDHINLNTDDWSIVIQEQTPDQPSGTFRDALSIKPAYTQGGSNKTIILDANGTLTPASATDIRFHYKPQTCDDIDQQQKKCDLLSQIIIKSYHQRDKTILCKSKGTQGDEAGKCKIKFKLNKCPDGSPCAPDPM